MTSRERIAIALRGGRPDRTPRMAIFDIGYVLRNTGRDPRDWALASCAECTRILEDNYLIHRPHLDGLHIFAGVNDADIRPLRAEKYAAYWRLTNTRTGRQWGLLPDGSVCAADGTPLPKQGEDLTRDSVIQTEADIERAFGPIPSEADVVASGRFEPIRHLAARYPDAHFSFQTASPLPPALNACGGYAEGLTLMATDRALFRKILARAAALQCTRMAPGKKAGACSTWFTSYYTGADTISPKDYADLIFPLEREICQEARRQGLFVLNWYLGDLLPNLDQVMQLPMDALVLEQGRKTYRLDPVEIRRRVGPRFCLFGYGFENDYVTFNRDGLAAELRRQFEGAGRDGAFIVGAPIIPPNAQRAAVAYYFTEILP